MAGSKAHQNPLWFDPQQWNHLKMGQPRPLFRLFSVFFNNVSIGKNQLKEIFYLIVLFFQSGMKGRGRQKKQSESPSLPPPPGPGLTAGGRKKLVKGSGISPSAALDLLHKATMDSINCKPTPSFR